MTLLLLTAAAAFVAVPVALAAGAGAHASLLALAALSGFLVLIHCVVLFAGLLGQLTVGGLGAVVGVVLVSAIWLARPHRHDERAPGLPAYTPATAFGPVLAIVTVVAWAWPHVFDATRLWIWDDYTYHMVYPAIWLRERVIAAVPAAQTFTMQAWYPLSASVVATWFMAPFHDSRGDALAWVSLTGPLYLALIATAMAELLRRLGCRRGAWGVPVVLVATSERIGVMGSSFSDADLAVAGALFAAVTFAVPRHDEESPRATTTDLWYAALLCGFALGVKASAAPAVMLIAMTHAMRVHASGQRRRLPHVALVFAVAVIGTAGYWYARNIVHTGNPLYPAASLLSPGATFPQTTLREYAQHYGLARTLRDASAVYLHWPLLHGIGAAAGLVGLAAWLAIRRGATSRPRRYFGALAVGIVAITLVLLPVTPYSAGNPMTFVSGFVHWDSMRYVALLPLLAWTAVGFLLDTGVGAAGWRVAIATTGMTAAVLAGITRANASGLFIAAIVGAVVIGSQNRAVGLLSRHARVVAIGAACVIAAIVGASHRHKADVTAAALYREPLFGAAAAVLDRQPAGTRVAIFGDQWVYPVFGARDHLVPVRLDGDGRIATTPIGDAMTPGPLTVSPATFRANLAVSRVDVVAVVWLPHPGRSPTLPNQHDALGTVAGAGLIHRDAAVAIWRLAE